MTNPIIKIVNAETGEEIEREMTAEELAQYEADKILAQAEAQALVAKQTEKQAILDRLGLSKEEAALLLGDN